jgi:hypothetical protein
MPLAFLHIAPLSLPGNPSLGVGLDILVVRGTGPHSALDLVQLKDEEFRFFLIHKDIRYERK